jgi:radical SAM protein with 4Fe4S-binding SPASM domain
MRRYFPIIPGDLCENISIGYEITRNCTLRCPYCYVTNRQHEGEELGKTDWLLLSQVLAKCLSGFNVHVNLSGGEIFVKDWVIEIIQYLLKKGIHVGIGTNGLHLPDVFLQEDYFRNNKYFQIAISLDGSKPVHELTRTDFDTVSHNIESLIKTGVYTIVKTTAYQGNLKNILELCKYLNHLGNKHNLVIPHEVQPALAGPRKEIKVDIQNFHSLKLILSEYIREGLYVTGYAKNHLKHIKSQWRFIGEVPETQKRTMCLESALFGCATGFGFDVMANGDIAACEMDLPMGNIKNKISEETLLNILDVLWKKMTPHQKCVPCQYKLYCGMCRLTPLMHGYTEGFGYDDCQMLMHDIFELITAQKK